MWAASTQSTPTSPPSTHRSRRSWPVSPQRRPRRRRDHPGRDCRGRRQRRSDDLQPTNSPDRLKPIAPDLRRCSTTPAPVTPSSLLRSTGWGGQLPEVTRTIADLGERRITLRALREGVDTATPTGRAVAAIMATLAELELELGREPRAASREARRARSLPATKPTKLSAERQVQLRRLAATGEPVCALAAAFGIGRATAYRYLG